MIDGSGYCKVFSGGIIGEEVVGVEVSERNGVMDEGYETATSAGARAVTAYNEIMRKWRKLGR